ncbi:hypothetical protein CCACVL1_13246 [Corchorus capsularis]|uniref:F-box domain-containing protein n=1 Tax=Corchorus capsularis TaxID=210143 RepID=A0A1R3IBP6_COCAP|nr:hypothetical protein CCACVL1_13246 [Corchorus capsularis]
MKLLSGLIVGVYLWKLGSSAHKILKGICEKHKHAPAYKLTDDIWNLIFQRLPLVDRINAGAVSKQWFSITSKIPCNQPVWILLPPDKDLGPGEISFFDLCDGTFGKMKLPDGCHPLGTCRGWFATISFGTNWKSNKIQLFDPVSRIQIPLPPLSTITEQIPSWELGTDFLASAVDMSSNDASESVVAACFAQSKILALCRPKDKKWTVFTGLGIDNLVHERYRYTIMKFCNGILYALIAPGNEDDTLQFQTYSMKLPGDDRDVVLKLINLSWFITNIHPVLLELPWIQEQEDDDDVLVLRNASINYGLVESNGEILVVDKIEDAIMKIPEHVDHDDEPEDPYFRIARFEVSKLEASDDALWLTKLSNLNDQTLFNDAVNLVSMPATGRNFGKNCVYFLDNPVSYMQQGWEPAAFSRESGVFYLKDGRIERPFPSLEDPKNSRYYWFFPNIKHQLKFSTTD